MRTRKTTCRAISEDFVSLDSRFPVAVSLDGRSYGAFALDAGFGDPTLGAAEELVGSDWLAFAGLAPARVRAIPRAQQFAEKIHAYTRPRGDRENTRTKDLVDLLLLIERGELVSGEVRSALAATFDRRKRKALPHELLPPPASWRLPFEHMAHEAGLEHRELATAFERLRAFWGGLELD
jgi:Nucleotidyl transferase AbiEii toxin, Type IV TA system